MKGYSTFTKSPRLKPHNGLLLYPGHSLERSLTPLQRCCQSILQPQPSELRHYMYKHMFAYNEYRQNSVEGENKIKLNKILKRKKEKKKLHLLIAFNYGCMSKYFEISIYFNYHLNYTFLIFKLFINIFNGFD